MCRWAGLTSSLVLAIGCAPRAPAAAPSPPAPPPPSVAPPPPVDALAKSRHVALGLPRDADPADEVVLDRGEFVVSYDTRRNAANWVAWHLRASDLGSAKRTSGFHTDEALPRGAYAVRDRDYVRSGFDRGHLCPSAERTASPEANRATFSLINAHPQFHELNAGPWEKLETFERELSRTGKELYLVAGGLFGVGAARIGQSAREEERVAVPEASYKIVVVLEPGQKPADVGNETTALAVVMPNQRDLPNADFRSYLTSVDEVERASGYDFHTRVPLEVQAVFESRVAKL